MFWFSVKQIQQTAAQLLTWKALSAVFHGGKKLNQPKPAEAEAKGCFISFGFQSALLPDLHAQQGKLSSSSFCRAGSCLAHLQPQGRKEGKAAPATAARSMGTCPCSSSPQTTWKLPADFTWHPLIETFRWAARNLPHEVAWIHSWHLFCNFHLYLICFVGLCFWGFFYPKAFLLRNHQFPSRDDYKLLLLSPSGHIGIEKSSRDECEAKPTDGLQAILQTALPCAANSRATSRQHTKHRSLCSNFCPAPLLFSSTAIPFGTDQDLVSDHSKTCLLTRGNSQHLLSLPYSFCHWKRWCFPLGSHLLGAQQ